MKARHIVALTILLLSCTLICGCSSEIETQAEEDARELKSMMKNPNSFTIHGDITVLEHAYEDGTTTILVAIDHSGENSYGGTTRDTALFSDGKYLGGYDDEIDLNGYSSEEEIDDALSIASAKLSLLTADPDELTSVDGRRVARKVDAEYVD